MLLRLAIWLSVVVFSNPAWAEGGGISTDQLVEALKAGGPWGMVGLCFTVIVILWNGNSSRDDEIKSLNKDLITAVRQAESTAGDSANAIKAFEIENRNAAAVAQERWDAVKGMSSDITKVGMLVDGNKQGIADLKTTIEGLRGDIQALWRRSQS